MCFNNITQILSLLPNTFTYESDTSDRKLGNGERGQNLQKGSKGVFWGSARVLHLIAMWVPSFWSSGGYLLQTQQMPDEADHWRPRPRLPPPPVRIQVWNDSQLWEKRRFFTQWMLNFDNRFSWFFTSSWPWNLLIKPPTLGGNGIWNLRFLRLESSKEVVGKRRKMWR